MTSVVPTSSPTRLGGCLYDRWSRGRPVGSLHRLPGPERQDARLRSAMITKQEIEEKAAEFDIHVANVERDYVFGWILTGIYTASPLKEILILKGGNGLRKAYF